MKKHLGIASASLALVFGAVLLAQEKGGGDETGPYDLVRGWPQNYCGEGHVIGSTAGIWAESPDRVYIFSRGCLPVAEDTRGAADAFIPARNASGYDLSQRISARHPRWDHVFNVVDRHAELIDTRMSTTSCSCARTGSSSTRTTPSATCGWWTTGHAIYKFTRDGKKLVMTVGTPMQPGDDATHFNRPTDIAWLPDGTFYVSDGYVNTRVAKFDRDGKFLMTWGQKGIEPTETRPSDMNTVHAIVIDKNRRHLHQRPGQLARPGVRRERQVPRRVAQHAPALLGAALRGPAPVGGRRHYAEVHQVRPDRQAPLLVGHVRRLPRRVLGRTPVPHRQRGQPLHRRRARRTPQKFRPKKGANPAHLIGAYMRGTNLTRASQGRAASG